MEKVRKYPEKADELLTTALQRRPQDPTLIACLGDLRRNQKRWVEARDLYARVLALRPNDVRVRADVGGAHVQLAEWNGAVEALEAVRQNPTLTDDSRASIVAHLALAYIALGDISQAVELVAAQPLERRTLNSGLEQCLFVRAIARYLLGERSRAVRDLARLHALNPDFVQARQAKAAMENGTFELT